MRRSSRRERGSVLVFSALTLTVLMTMAAFTIDVGLLFVERREDQSAADTGALGGGLDMPNGVDAASESAAELVRVNLDTAYTDIEWAALWASCSDPDALTYTGTVLGTATSCISLDGLGTIRVVIPDQEVEAIFAGVLGYDSLISSAFAEASLTLQGIGGMLPFAVLSSAASGSELCLRSSSGGTATPPCTGSDSGNFGALEIPQWGNPAFGTDGLPCNINKADQLIINLSVGIDHYTRIWDGTDVVDGCAEPYGPNTLPLFEGISRGLFQGMITGDVVQGHSFAGRLTKGNTGKLALTKGGSAYLIDNVPLWEYIPTGKDLSVPSMCTRESFETTVALTGYADAETQMAICLTEYAAGSGYAKLFDLDTDGDGIYNIVGSPRYGIVPQFVESSFPSGGSADMHIIRFRAVFLSSLHFKCNGTSCGTVLTPGSSTGSVPLPNGKNPLDQVTGYLLPTQSIPDGLIDNGVNGTLNGYQISLSR